MYTTYRLWQLLIKYLEMPMYHFLSIFSSKIGWQFRLGLAVATFELGVIVLQYANGAQAYHRKKVIHISIDLYHIQQARSLCKEKLNGSSSLT